MAEDPTNLQTDDILSLLEHKRDRQSTGNIKGVRLDTQPGAVRPDLTSSEIARYTKVFGLWKGVINSGSEAAAGTIKTTKVGKVGIAPQMQQAGSKSEKVVDKVSILSEKVVGKVSGLSQMQQADSKSEKVVGKVSGLSQMQQADSKSEKVVGKVSGLSQMQQAGSKSEKVVGKDTKTGRIKPDLESPEISRWKKIFGLMKDVMDPGPEARTIKTTKAASIGKLGDMQKSEVPATAGPGKSWLKLLLFGLAAAAAAWIAQFIDGFAQWGLKTILKVKLWFKPLTTIITSMGTKFRKFINGFKPVLGMVDKITSFFGGFSKAVKAAPVLGRILSVGGSIMKVIKTAGMAAGKVLMKFGRFLPWIGSIFSFGFAIEKYLKGDLVGGTLELVSGIINLLPGGVFVSALLDGYILYRDMTSGKDTESGVNPESGEPGMLSKIWTSIKGWFSANFTKLPIIAGIAKMGNAVVHLKRGEWLPGFRALYQVIPSLIGGSVGGDLIGKGFDFVIDLIASAGSVISNSESGEPGMLSKIWTSIKGWFSANFTKLPIIAGIAKMGNAVVHLKRGEWLPGLRTLYQVIPSLIGGSVGGDLIGKGFNFVIDLIASADKVSYDSVTAAAGDAWGWVKDIFSDIGEVFSGLFTAISDWVSGAIDAGKEKIKEYIPDVVLDLFEEDTPEEVAAAKAGKSMASKSQWSNGYPSIGQAINDGMISKDGTVTRFDARDDVLAAKSGGPIDKLLDANSVVMSELNNVNKNQLNVLISIRDGINMLVSKSGGTTSTATGGSTKVQYNTNPLTQEFYA